MIQVAILTETQKEQLLGQQYDPDSYFNPIQDEDNNCLITNLPLSDKFVTLSCGHKFNYVPLYNDIFNHKQKFNVMESSVSSLMPGEIRCPYW